MFSLDEGIYMKFLMKATTIHRRDHYWNSI